MARLGDRIAPDTAELGIEKVLILGTVEGQGRRGPAPGLRRRPIPPGTTSASGSATAPTTRSQPLDDYGRKVVALRRRDLVYPYDLVRMLAPPADEAAGDHPPGDFAEYDLEDDRLVPVDRPPGENTANVIVGVITNFTHQAPRGDAPGHPAGRPHPGDGEPVRAGVPPDQRRHGPGRRARACPLEWFAVSAGALISMESGTENMDWIARVLRRIIEFTQAGGEINIVVPGINVGAQPYWNAEATMLMHTKGILVMTPGRRHGAHRQGGPRLLRRRLGRGQPGHRRLRADHGPQRPGPVLRPRPRRRLPDPAAALRPHLRRPRRALPPTGRDQRPDRPRRLRLARTAGDFATVGDVFSMRAQPRPQAAVRDPQGDGRRRRPGSPDPGALVRRARTPRSPSSGTPTSAGIPVCLLGIESKNLPRAGFVPADGPDAVDRRHALPAGLEEDGPGHQRRQRQPPGGRAGQPVGLRRLARVDAAPGSSSTAPRSAGPWSTSTARSSSASCPATTAAPSWSSRQR